MEMDKLKGDRGSSHGRHLPSFPKSSPTKPSSKETRMSFEPSLSGGSVNGVPESVRRQCKEDGSLNRHQRKQEQEHEEVLKCSSNASFPRQAIPLSRLKTKSRLLYDPSPEELERMSGRVPKSGTMRSGILSRVFDDEEDEDPLEDVDLPDEYKKDKLSTVTVLQWLSLVVILAALVCSLSILDLKKVNILNLKLWKWEVLLVVLICGSTYFDEIRESLFNQFVIEALPGPPLIEIQKAEDDAERIATEVLKLQNAGATIPVELKESVFPPAKSGRLNPNRQCRKLSQQKAVNFLENFHKKGRKKGMILGAATEDESMTHIISKYEAKVAARKIFANMARHGSKYIYLQDLMRFLEEDQASKTMSFFEEASETSRIGKSSLKNWVVNAFRERRALALTLNDTKTAVNKLHQMINIIFGIVIVVISLVILGIAKINFFMLLGSQFLVVSFIFGNTAKTLFESIIFLFVIHPFDVGDSVLATKSIGVGDSVEFHDSPDMGDSVEFHHCIQGSGRFEQTDGGCMDEA
ncbi:MECHANOSENSITIVE ION CHANNEL PROTEIN 5 [Salix koriyanagi]|uniref:MECHANOSENSITIVE ION CHANNEL PROTEIN 5 n=1 Tax=Salix koriyanagi TaxID=2511006 RepID=A0A9Q0V121_9ROSI|nr:MECHANOSENSITIVE ION CHANNEL PROTEIN 5 [Salix koriyanagi]